MDAQNLAITPNQTSSRDNNFNILKFLAAFLVVLGHLYSLNGMPQFAFGGISISTIGVYILLAISGYFITISWNLSKNPIQYILKRIFRIFPLFIVTILLTVFVLGPCFTFLSFGEYFAHPSTWQYMLNIILHPIYNLPGVFENYIYPNAINGSLWIIPVELVCYLLLPLLCLVSKKEKPYVGIAVFVLCVVGMILKRVVFPETQVVFWGNDITAALDVIPFFFAGHLLTYLDKKYFNLPVATISLLIVAFIGTPSYVNAPLFAIIIPYFVMSFGFAKPAVFNFFCKNHEISYEMFLIGFPIEQIITNWLKPYNLNFYLILLISMVFIITISFVLFFLVDKPIAKLLKKMNNLKKC